MPTINHFEIPSDDIEQVQKFYGNVFGWSMQKWSNPENPQKDYWMFETTDENGNKGLSGGLMKRQAPEHTMTNYVTVPSIDEYIPKIEQAGGKIMIPKIEIADMGFFAIFIDTENNQFGLFEVKR